MMNKEYVCCPILRNTAMLCYWQINMSAASFWDTVLLCFASIASLFLEMTVKQLQTLVLLQTMDVTISNSYDNPISLYAFKQTSDFPDNGNYGDSMNNCRVLHDQQDGFNCYIHVHAPYSYYWKCQWRNSTTDSHGCYNQFIIFRRITS